MLGWIIGVGQAISSWATGLCLVFGCVAKDGIAWAGRSLPCCCRSRTSGRCSARSVNACGTSVMLVTIFVNCLPLSLTSVFCHPHNACLISQLEGLAGSSAWEGALAGDCGGWCQNWTFPCSPAPAPWWPRSATVFFGHLMLFAHATLGLCSIPFYLLI